MNQKKFETKNKIMSPFITEEQKRKIVRFINNNNSDKNNTIQPSII
jgi:hypothetical protein